jgi:signal peptide peptidase SppA
MTRSARFQPRSPLALEVSAWGVELFERPEPVPFEEIGAYAVVDITGPLARRAIWFCDGYDAIAKRVHAALASNAPAVLLRIASPGGEVHGCFELVDEIRAAAKAAGKEVVAYVDGAAMSAAYAIACAADRIVVPPTGMVGSIGTITMALDATKADDAMGLKFAVISSGARKADGNPHTAMSDETRASIQSKIDTLADIFFGCVAGARGRSLEEIKAHEADTFIGAQAVSVGLADEVGTFASLVAASAVTAQSGKENDMPKEEEAKAALKSVAEGDDEKKAARAKKALAALEDESEDEKKDDETKAAVDDEKKEEAKAHAEGGEEKKDDETKASSSLLVLAAQVQTLSRKLAERDESEERTKLMASRPDLADEVVSLLARSPIAVVRDAVKTLPRGAAKGQVGAAIAALGVAPSVTGKDATATRQLPQDEHDALMREMGVLPPEQKSAVRADGSMSFSAPVPSELRKQMKGETK